MLADTLIVIPARLKSTRLPNKPLEKIHGYPMIYWVGKRIKDANICDYVVATDSVEISDVCKKYDINVVMTSETCKNGSERVAEVAGNSGYKYYCNVQGDEPLVNVEGVRKFIKEAISFKNTFVQAITHVQHIKNDITEVKVALDLQDRVRFLSRSPIPFDRNSSGDVNFKCIGLYLYERDFILKYIKISEGYLEGIECVEQLRCIENDLPIVAIRVNFDSISIDTLEDLKLARSYPASHYK
jgi:3-deoxy-manno-octulosonate cytidylyltransferase (CMP-KDO synthetase)